jgi:hypothetical protein
MELPGIGSHRRQVQQLLVSAGSIPYMEMAGVEEHPLQVSVISEATHDSSDLNAAIAAFATYQLRHRERRPESLSQSQYRSAVEELAQHCLKEDGVIVHLSLENRHSQIEQNSWWWFLANMSQRAVAAATKATS